MGDRRRFTRLAALGLALAGWLGWFGSDSAQAYDLSRSYDYADEVERGFVVGSAALWVPAFGSFNTYHQLSLQVGGEVGFRVASIRGDHNLYVVGGFSYSPQQLDPDYIDRADYDYRDTRMIVGYVGVRYLPGLACINEGMGCPFIELRFGLTYEDTNDRTYDHAGPEGSFTFLPGVGYRFRFGRSFQVGARLDVSYTDDSYSSDLGWLELTSFLGFGW